MCHEIFCKVAESWRVLALLLPPRYVQGVPRESPKRGLEELTRDGEA